VPHEVENELEGKTLTFLEKGVFQIRSKAVSLRDFFTNSDSFPANLCALK
jgi:hypothetical protein